MRLKTYDDKLVTTEVTKTYTDFNTANPLSITQLNAGDVIVGFEVYVNDYFSGISDSESIMILDPVLVSNLNITNGNDTGDFTDLVTAPILISPSAWTTETNFETTSKGYSHPCGGSQSAAIAAGGWHGGAALTANVGQNTELWDGVNWVDGSADMNVGRWGTNGCGSQSAALTYAGNNSSGSTTTLTSSEEFNGVSWSTGGSLSVSRYYITGCGTQTAGLALGGLYSSTDYKTTEEYDGASWASGGDLLLAGSFGYGSFGLQSAATAFCGWGDSWGLMPSMEYDGTSWQIANPTNIVTSYSSGAGTQSLGIKIGGRKPNQYNAYPEAWTTISQCETYDGSSWTMASDTNAPKSFAGTAGSQAETLIFGGNVNLTTFLSTCESHTTDSYNASIKNIRAIITNNGLKAWTVAKDLNVIRFYGAGCCGTQSAGLIFGGSDGVSALSSTEEYDGSFWVTTSNLNLAYQETSGCGTQTAGLKVGGYNNIVDTEEYNGAAWSNGGDLSIGRERLATCGSQNAALAFGGTTTVYLTSTEEYNGTSWSAGGDLGTARNAHGGSGTQTSGLCFGGWTGATIPIDTTDEYNGSVWATAGSLSTIRWKIAGCGSQNASLCFGGTDQNITLKSTEEYNGTNWSFTTSLNIARIWLSGCGTSTAGLAVGGQGDTVLGTTEEFDVKTAGTGDWNAGSLTFKIKYIKYSG